MERLLADAGKIAGVKFDITSYADVVEAIHVMQESMGIAGTTALEAEETISGSLNAMKSAWANMLVGFGDADADMQNLTKNLVDAFGSVVTNVVPIIQNIAKALPDALGAMLPAIGQLLPDLLKTVTSLFEEVLDALFEILPELIPVAVEAILTIVDTVIENLPLVIDAAITLIGALAKGVIEALPELVPKIVEVVNKIATTIIENLPIIIDVALRVMIALAGGLIMAIPQLVKAVPQIMSAIVKAFAGLLSKMVGVGGDIVKGVWQGISSSASWLLKKVKKWCGSILDGIKAFFGIKSPSKVFQDEVGKNMALGLGDGFSNEMKNVTKQINNSIPTDIDMTMQPQIISNAISPQSQPVNITLTLDGKVLARHLYDPLQSENRVRGRTLTVGV